MDQEGRDSYCREELNGRVGETWRTGMGRRFERQDGRSEKEIEGRTYGSGGEHDVGGN